MTKDEEMTTTHIRAACFQLRLALLTEKNSGRECWIEQLLNDGRALIWLYGGKDDDEEVG